MKVMAPLGSGTNETGAADAPVAAAISTIAKPSARGIAFLPAQK
jgi:hypothetical protein